MKRTISRLRASSRRRAAGERGASLVEYALLVALIAVVCIGAVTFLGTSGSSKLDRAGKAVEGKQLVHCEVFGTTLLYLYYDDGSTESVPGTECPDIP